MNPEHIWNWTRGIFTIVCLVVVVGFYRDYHGASVTWRGGRVVRKVEPSTFHVTDENYYIGVEVDGPTGEVNTGSVSVTYPEYCKWQVGQPCEVSFHHGRIKDYDFAKIRHPGEETGGRGWWWGGRRDWW